MMMIIMKDNDAVKPSPSQTEPNLQSTTHASKFRGKLERKKEKRSRGTPLPAVFLLPKPPDLPRPLPRHTFFTPTACSHESRPLFAQQGRSSPDSARQISRFISPFSQPPFGTLHTKQERKRAGTKLPRKKKSLSLTPRVRQHLVDVETLLDIAVEHAADEVDTLVAEGVGHAQVAVHDLIDAVEGVLLVDDGVEEDSKRPDVLLLASIRLTREHFGCSIICDICVRFFFFLAPFPSRSGDNKARGSGAHQSCRQRRQRVRS